MKIVTILGSPRKNGCTGKVMGWIEEALRAAGHTVERINVIDHNIKGFEYSEEGGLSGAPGAADDAIAVMDRMVAADAVLMGAPVFCWGVPAQLKALIDRTIYLVGDFIGDPNYETKLQNKPLGFVVTSGGPKEDNAEFPIKMFERMVKFMKAKDGGCLHVPGCMVPAAIGDDVKAQAVAFAKTFAAAK